MAEEKTKENIKTETGKKKRKKREKKSTHTLIISDLHLGSRVAQPAKVLKLLKSYNFRKLILLGDVFDGFDLKHLTPESLELLNYIGKISRDKKVRWVKGNHDEGLYEIFGPLMNAKIHETYVWQYKKERYLAMHGHQFDRFLIDNVFLSRLASWIYNQIQRFDFADKRVSHYVKRESKGWLRISQKVAEGAVKEAKKNGAKYAFCGHTHKPLEKTNFHHVRYYNAGCWTDTPCSYITIDKRDIRIRKF